MTLKKVFANLSCLNKLNIKEVLIMKEVIKDKNRKGRNLKYWLKESEELWKESYNEAFSYKKNPDGTWKEEHYFDFKILEKSYEEGWNFDYRNNKDYAENIIILKVNICNARPGSEEIEGTYYVSIAFVHPYQDIVTKEVEDSYWDSGYCEGYSEPVGEPELSEDENLFGVYETLEDAKHLKNWINTPVLEYILDALGDSVFDYIDEVPERIDF